MALLKRTRINFQKIYSSSFEQKLLTALCAQTQTKKTFDSIAKQCCQKFSCSLFDQKLL
jgi:hypothetical protein